MRNKIQTPLAGLLLLSVLLGGCDFPDRHDIDIFRKPAAWEVNGSSTAVENSIVKQLSLGVDPDPSAPSKDQWHFWYLHLVDSVGVVGGVDMQSERIADRQSERIADRQSERIGNESDRRAGDARAPAADTGDALRPAIKVTLRESVLIQSDVPETDLAPPPSDWQPNSSRYLTGNLQTFWHAADGRLVRADCRVRMGPLETQKSALITPELVRVESDYVTRKTNKQLPHQGPLAGPLAVYQSLLADPLQPQQKREVTVMLPIQESLAQLRIQSRPDALAKRMSQQGLVVNKLHEAIALVTINESEQRQRFYWYDDGGVVQATNITGEKRNTYRCEQEQYQSLGTRFLSHDYPISVDVPGKPLGAGRIKQLAVDVELSPHWVARQSQTSTNSTALSPRLPAAPRQYVQNMDVGHQRVITARENVPSEKLAGRFELISAATTSADLAATAIVDYRSASVRNLLAISGAMNSMTDIEKARELNRTVHSLLTFTPLSAGIRPASLIADTSLADSTEHAILLVAMLRGKGIPARLAAGLRYLPVPTETQTTVSTASRSSDSADASATSSNSPVHRFVYHVWAIAKADNNWVSLDATSGEETAPDCITLYTDDLSALDAGQFVDRFLAVLRSVRLTVSAAVMQRGDK